MASRRGLNRAGFCGGSNSCEDGAMTKRTPPFSPEIRERAVRMVLEHQGEHGSQHAAIRSIAAKIGCSSETLRNWVRQAERDQGVRAGPTTDERERIKALERENRELRQANEILRRRAPILPRRSPPAGSGHDCLHRRPLRRLRGRADLPRAADRPVDLLRPCRATGGSRKPAAPVHGGGGAW